MAQMNKSARELGWTGQLRRFVLASVGVAFVAKDEVREMMDRLVEKGESAERDGRKLVNSLLSTRGGGLTENGRRVIEQLGKRTKAATKDVQRSLETAAGVTRGLASTVQSRINRRIEKVLHKMNLVSRTDVEDLNSKIDQLSRKLDRLGKK